MDESINDWWKWDPLGVYWLETAAVPWSGTESLDSELNDDIPVLCVDGRDGYIGVVKALGFQPLADTLDLSDSSLCAE